MKINNLKVQNFKGIEELQINFDPNLTVLIGDNGAGKSSVLDAISIAIGTILMRTTSSFGINGRKTRPLMKDEIRKIMLSPDNIEYSDVQLSGQFLHEDQIYNWERTQLKTSKSLSYGDAKTITNLGLDMASKVDENIPLPLFAYHSTARLAGEIFGKTTFEKIGSRLDGYYACLDPRSIKKKFISWFKTFEDSALKFNKDKTLYYAFTNAISTMVPNWSDIKFHWGLDDMVGLHPNGEWLPLSNLSDGYRSIIRLTADIAYRAIKLNPHFGERAVLDTEGIVLIDEIDMHLHPKWQKRILSDLKTVFPKIQFIITTHSPFIVQSLYSNEIINLDDNRIDQNPNEMDIAQNSIFMGVDNSKSALFNEKEKLAFDYLNILNTNKEIATLDSLEKLIHNTNDPAFKAKMKIEKLIKFEGK